MDDHTHIGHRNRVKNEFLSKGYDKNTPPHKILETLLFFCLPQGDTNPLAHELLNRYGSIAGVLDAPVEELITFKGITRSNVVLFKLIPTVMRIYNSDKQNGNPDFHSFYEIGDFLLGQYLGVNEENLSVLSLNGNGRMLSFDIVETGDIGSVGVSTRKIIRLLLNTQASCVVIAHNHPGGIALPSGADEIITQNLYAALSHINVRLLDHIIIADNDYVSMAQSQKYSHLFK